MGLYDLYVRFMVWLGAEPPPGYEYLLAKETGSAKVSASPPTASKPASGQARPIQRATVIPRAQPKPPPVQPAPTATRPAIPSPPKPPLPGQKPGPTYVGEAQVLYRRILLKSMHDHELADRLIQRERERSPGASDVEILQTVIDRWEHDYRTIKG